MTCSQSLCLSYQLSKIPCPVKHIMDFHALKLRKDISFLGDQAITGLGVCLEDHNYAAVLTCMAVLIDVAALGELCLAALTGTSPDFVATAVGTKFLLGFVPAGSSSSVPADYVSAGHVLVSADRDRIC
ncbi:hypothetical protein Tco_1508342 [Tanacetum coccineum]